MELTQDGFLNGRIRAWQPRKGYRAATDPVLLAAATPASDDATVLDLGCGVGVASLCLAARLKNLKMTGVEIQGDYADLARRNAEENGVNFTVFDADLATLPKHITEQSFDHVIANPPYFRTGSLAEEPGKAIARHEATPLSDWVKVAKRRLSPKGWFTIVLPIERMPELMALLIPGFGDICVKPLSARQGRVPNRFILKARKGAKGPFRLCEPLILHAGATHLADGDDQSAEANQILRDGAALAWD